MSEKRPHAIFGRLDTRLSMVAGGQKAPAWAEGIYRATTARSSEQESPSYVKPSFVNLAGERRGGEPFKTQEFLEEHLQGIGDTSSLSLSDLWGLVDGMAAWASIEGGERHRPKTAAAVMRLALRAATLWPWSTFATAVLFRIAVWDDLELHLDVVDAIESILAENPESRSSLLLAATYGRKAWTLRGLQRWVEASENARRALDIWQKRGGEDLRENRVLFRAAIITLGLVGIGRGDLEELRFAIGKLEEAGDQELTVGERVSCHMLRGSLLWAEEKLDQASNSMIAAIEICREKCPDAVITFGVDWAELEAGRDEGAAKARLVKALAWSRESGASRGLEVELAEALTEQGTADFETFDEMRRQVYQASPALYREHRPLRLRSRFDTQS